ncbi:uncharacterized protein conserved in bacteria, prophage-related [Hahella chejuensis KCTC 2396]|uniref:Uncharacterized protein conserved in bacteria, prophage-related n=1 Tax=Hahella chejuensis (strain KCTC 2396) TaxID=349521 RepID=Q2SPC5_HAHCH|nr:Cro/CI family transcriptional regulator [Hahella chejuensis]ABC27499.1 uncharacterized protein conserved in bacteria, prophage-related [Hahella chejuensis KCTC 2396]
MRKADAVAYFGGKSKLANALGVAPASVSQRGEFLPMLRAYQVERMTGGKLRVRKRVVAQIGRRV